MALSTSFSGGWYFFGQFFDHAVAGIPVTKVPGYRHKTRGDVLRTRGQFGATESPQSLMQRLAPLYIDASDESLIQALRRELDERYIEWRPEFADEVLEMKSELVAERDRQRAAAEASKNDWLKRRQASLRRAH